MGGAERDVFEQHEIGARASLDTYRPASGDGDAYSAETVHRQVPSELLAAAGATVRAARAEGTGRAWEHEPATPHRSGTRPAVRPPPPEDLDISVSLPETRCQPEAEPEAPIEEEPYSYGSSAPTTLQRSVVPAMAFFATMIVVLLAGTLVLHYLGVIRLEHFGVEIGG